MEALADLKSLRKEEAMGRTEGSVPLEGSEGHCQGPQGPREERGGRG